jgi:hypothetical protein
MGYEYLTSFVGHETLIHMHPAFCTGRPQEVLAGSFKLDRSGQVGRCFRLGLLLRNGLRGTE